jgi:hypothetical protein
MTNGEFEYSKLLSYRRQAQLEDRGDIKEFIVAVNEGEYPAKCLDCYEIGIRWCRWWEENFECGFFEAEKSINIIKAFFDKKKVKREKNVDTEQD